MMLNTYRKYDAVLVVCQNNAEQRIEIAGANEKAQQVLGHSAEALAGRLLTDFLEARVIDRIEDYVNYADPFSDVGDIFAKTHSLKVKNTDGEMQEFRLRVVRSEAVDNNPVFHLVLQDEQIHRENEAFKQILTENFKGHEVVDERTHLPDRASMLKDLELVQHYKQKKEFSASFGVIRIDGVEALRTDNGQEVCYQILRHIGQLCRQRLRKDDHIGLISGSALGIILMDITPESARIVLNRLRFSVSSMPVIMEDGAKHDITVSICFHMINNVIPEDILMRCEEKLRNMQNDGVSAILEVA